MGKVTLRKAIVFVSLAAALLTFSFMAEAGTLTITNNSGYDIHELYISASGAQSWGPDLLGEYYLENGDEHEVMIPNYDQFDVKIVDDSGNWTDWRGIPGVVVRFYVDRNRQARWEWN